MPAWRRPRPKGPHRWRTVAAAPRDDERHRARRDACLARVGAAGQHDRHARTEHDAGARRAAEVLELLREHVAALEVGHDQDVGGTGDIGNDPLGARGGSGHGVVESERPVDDGAFDLAAVGHLAQRRGIQRGRHVRIDGLDRGEDSHARPLDAERMGKVDRVAHDVCLLRQRRRDVERRVGDDERPRVGGRLHQEAMAHATAGAQRTADDRAHQFVGMQAALHQRFDLAFECQLDGALGGGLGVRHVLDRNAVDLQTGLVGNGLQSGARRHEHGLDQSRALSVERRGKADRVARMDDSHLQAPQRPHVLQQPDEVVAVGEFDSHVGQRAAGALDALGRRAHRGFAGDHGLTILVDAGAVQRHAMVRLVPRGHGDGDRQRVADAHRRVKLQRLPRVYRAGPWQARAEHRRDQRGTPHAVRDDAVEARRRGELGIDVLRVDVARHRGEQLDVRGGEGAFDARAVADRNLVEGAVADDLEVMGGEGAAQDSACGWCHRIDGLRKGVAR